MKKHRIVFATGNAGKMKEIRLIMEDLGCEVVSMKEAGADPEIEENGTTFAENAEIKARAVWNCTGDIVLADDSGWWWITLAGSWDLFCPLYGRGYILRDQEPEHH